MGLPGSMPRLLARDMGANPKSIPTPLRNSYWVLPGKVLAGEHPGGNNREATRERLQRLIDAGVECFIDLTETGEIKPYDGELPFSIEYLRKPIRDHSIPAQRIHMVEILDCLHDALQSGRGVYVHCRAGIGRTGTVIGCFLADCGADGEAALNELNRLWQQSERSQSWGRVPETDEQEDFVRKWKPRTAPAGTPTPPGGWPTFSAPASATAVADRPRQPAATANSPGQPAADSRRSAALAANNLHQPSSAVPADGRGRPAAPTANKRRHAPAPATAPAPELASTPANNPRQPAAAALNPGHSAATAADPRQAAPFATNSSGQPSASGANSSGQPAAATTSPGHATAMAANRDHPSAAAANSSRHPAAPAPHAPDRAAAPAANNRRQPAAPATDNAPEPTSAPANSARPPAAAATSDARGQPAAPTSNSPVEDELLLDSGALAAVRGLRDRFLGTMLGLAVGDAVAAATQFRRAGTFTPVGDMLGGGPFDLPRGGWSDDTSMTLCLADSLLACEGFDARDQMERYRQWQQEGYLTATGQCVGITASTTRAIAMSQWRRQAFSGSHDPAQLDPEPLARVAAAVLFFFASPGQAIEQATEAARTTCQAPAVLDACGSLARALHAALSGQPKAVVLEIGAAMATSGAARNGPGASSAPAALTAAMAAFGATGNFRDAVLYAANLGGDSDVVAAVTGQLAGAFYTVKAIPTSWYNGLMQKELISAYADKLLARAMLGLSG
jgi:ADP-ribosyl-[dinitrogen reductase] hydrolase